MVKQQQRWGDRGILGHILYLHAQHFIIIILSQNKGVLFYLIVSNIVGNLRDQEVACSASDRQGSNFESCVWRAASSHASHNPQDVLLDQF